MAVRRSLLVRRDRAVRRSLGEDLRIEDSVALRRLHVAVPRSHVAVPRSQVVVRRLLADRKAIVDRRLIVVVAARDRRTWMAGREVLVRKAAIVQADRDLRDQKQVAVQKVAVSQKRAVVRLVKVIAPNAAGLKADVRKVTVQNVEHLSVADLAVNQRAITSMWKP